MSNRSIYVLRIRYFLTDGRASFQESLLERMRVSVVWAAHYGGEYGWQQHENSGYWSSVSRRPAHRPASEETVLDRAVLERHRLDRRRWNQPQGACVAIANSKAAFTPGQHVARQHVTCCRQHVTWSNMLSATKLLPVCCPSVAMYTKGYMLPRYRQHRNMQATCCRATCCSGVNAA